MQRSTKILFVALGSAGMLWLLSRTQRGQEITAAVVESTGDAVTVAASRAAALYASRGLRNNNPGNIRYNPRNQWQGQTGQDDEGFCVFDSPANGVRALGRVLESYARRGLTTVRGIIATWAPASENNTESYVRDVAAQTGIDADAVINVTANLPALATAIIRHENGRQPYDDADIAAWVYS